MICVTPSAINRFLKDRKDVNFHWFNPPLNVKTDDMMQGFVVTSYSIPSGEAKKGFLMDEDDEDGASSIGGKAPADWQSWEEQ
ncbi:MAG: hypothetical protein ACFN4H_01445 [Prevotella sp.]